MMKNIYSSPDQGISRCKLLIADDHCIIREGTRSLLFNEPDIDVVGTANNGHQAIELVKTLKPDFVLMDVSMPELNGIEATSLLMKEFPKLRILAFSMHAEHHFITAMLHAGAAGYLLKDCLFDELVFAIRTIHHGNSYFSPAIAHLTLPNRQVDESHASIVTPLSKRESEVLKLLVEGNPMRVVADQLFISVKTVETHRKHISEKLRLYNITEMVRYAIRECIIVA